MLTMLLLETQVRYVQVETRSLIGWLVLGLLAGWLAGKISRGRGFGCITDIVLGLIGGVLGGWLFTRLGIVSHADSFLYSLAAATVGAVSVSALSFSLSSFPPFGLQLSTVNLLSRPAVIRFPITLWRHFLLEQTRAVPHRHPAWRPRRIRHEHDGPPLR